ncbi:murein biosynthesis integral membrane protein MurJ [Aliiglaciecola sp. CAU 1673]|uniref:murein biosynthesis integral membrane protein MurJ n=1 Tax=Aliiglaciecola sp. CAU 1673 TaxID=3032595 RepID=UPI0023DA998B|nr:murein biosynthesis integral membrane protein MurJ [Aliiglaciecola sp. CAU 1673]MDF2178232.1 murein biosynthesis integral membrane protein MurJ [Aliiglaciecola sp. CAU 1673]
MSSKLLKSGLIVSAMTLLSRVLGLVRDVVVANLMGAGAAADVFFFANKIPNFLRRLFAEGAFAQAFVPVLSEVHGKHDEQALKLFLARVAGTLGTLVMIVTIIGVLGSPVLAALFGTGWFLAYLDGAPDGAKFELASLMLKITFPYLFFITLTGLSGAILNTLNKFAVAAFTPVLLNVAIISAAIWISPQLQEPAIGLAWGVFIGGIAQFAFQMPFLLRTGLLVKPRWGWRDPQVTKVRKLMIPALFGVSVSQINLLLDTFIASFLVTGSISWLYYSDRLLEFPLGLFGIAIATVILPTLSRNHVSADSAQFKANMDWALRMVCLLGIPAAAGLMVLAEPMMMVLFERGAFDAQDSQNASYSLIAYGSGLVSFMLVKVLAPGFFSRQDTKTPVRYGIWAMTANMVFNIILAIPFGYVGLAIATAMSATLNAALLYQKLHRLGVYQASRRTLVFLAKVLFGTLLMVAVLLFASPDMPAWRQLPVAEQGLQLAMLIGLGALVLSVACVLQGIHPSALRAWSAKRRKG